MQTAERSDDKVVSQTDFIDGARTLSRRPMTRWGWLDKR